MCTSNAARPGRQRQLCLSPYMIWHLALGGRMGMVLTNGALSSQRGSEGDIRKSIINADLMDCIVSATEEITKQNYILTLDGM